MQNSEDIYDRSLGAPVPRRTLSVAVLILLAMALASFCTAHASGDPTEPKGLDIDDYFRVRRIVELTISSDGALIAYVVAISDLGKNEVVREVYLQSTESGSKPMARPDLADARQLAWIPGSHQLAFLTNRSGRTQVAAYDFLTGDIHERTYSTDPVIAFRFAPDGRQLAYSSAAASTEPPVLFDRIRKDNAGILANIDTTLMYDFIQPYDVPATAPARMWLAPSSGRTLPVAIPGDAKEFFWSTDSKLLSITYLHDDMPPSILRYRRTSIGIVDARNGKFRELARGRLPSMVQVGTEYLGGEWIPNRHKLMMRRVLETDVWVSGQFPDLAVVDASTDLNVTRISWHAGETYGPSFPGKLAFFPLSESTFLVENTSQGIHSLFKWTDQGRTITKITTVPPGTNSLFSLTSNSNAFAFVNESLTQPPEIYVKSQKESKCRALTEFNEEIRARISFAARALEWRGSDGTIVHGWLLEPDQTRFPKPWPLITFVHGGPIFAYPDAFAPYFLRPSWSYPFEVYAERGLAVFIPNYRGTGSFGRPFSSPRSLDGEPVDDIVSGIHKLIDDGTADPSNLGISGHSHGGWLGPMVMTRAKIFRAGSFAEGGPNEVVGYEMMSLLLNREVHDTVHGGSLYDQPMRYVEQSPDLHMRDVHTATLLEGGGISEAVLMLGLAKAARRVGLPTEFIIYPKTDHVLEIPRLQRESANRNLDWFLFWLRGVQDRNPAKTEQYKRWQTCDLSPSDRQEWPDANCPRLR